MSRNKNKKDQASTQNEASFKKYEKPLTRKDFEQWLRQELIKTNLKSMTEPICNSTHDWIDYKGDRVHILITTEAVNKEKTGFDYIIKARIIHPGEAVGINMASGNVTDFVNNAKSMLYEDGGDDKDDNIEEREIHRTIDFEKATGDDIMLLFAEMIEEGIRIVEKEPLTDCLFIMTIYDLEMRRRPMKLPVNVPTLKRLRKYGSGAELREAILESLHEFFKIVEKEIESMNRH